MVTFAPGQLVQGQVRIRNTGNTPATFGVRVSPGTTSILGFSPELGGQTIITPRPVGRGDTVSLPVTIRLPQTPGPKTFRVETGETDLTGRIIRVIDTQDFANLADVRAAFAEQPGIAPLPGEPPLQQPPVPDLPMQFQESLGNPTISFLDTSLCQGEPFIGRFTVPTGASAPFSPELRISVLDNQRNVVNNLNLGRISVPAGGTIDRGFNIPTSALTPGSYFGSLSLVDPTSGLVLLGPLQFPPNALMVLDCPPEVAPAPPPTGALFGTPTINVFPFSVAPGEATTLRVRIPNTTPSPINPQLFGNITRSGTRVRSLPSISLSLNPLQDVDRSVPIDTTGLAAGLYGFRISLRDPASGAVLVQPTDFPTGFQVEAVAAAPAPTAPTVTPAIARNELRITYLGSDPRSPTRGQRVRVIFNVENQRAGRSDVQFSASMIDGGGRIRAGNLRTSAQIGPLGTTGIDFTFTVPDDVAPGFWTADIRAWDPETFVAGRTSTFIIEGLRLQMFSIGPAPTVSISGPPIAPTPSPTPTPAPTAAILSSSGTPSIRPTSLAPEETLTGLWGVRNTGGETGRVALFLDGPGGSQGPARSVAPGQSVALTVSISVPDNARTGRTTYGLGIRDLATGQTIAVTSQTITIEEPPFVGPTLETQLTLSRPRALPSTVSAGDSVILQFFAQETGGVTQGIDFSAIVNGPTGRVRGFGRISVRIGARQTSQVSLTVRLSSTAPPGSYTVQINWVPSSGGTVNTTNRFSDVFRVSS